MSILISATVNPMTILYSVLVLFVLALILGVALAVCGKKFAVKEDDPGIRRTSLLELLTTINPSRKYRSYSAHPRIFGSVREKIDGYSR